MDTYQNRRSFFKWSFKILSVMGLGGVLYSASRFLGTNSAPTSIHALSIEAFHQDNDLIKGSGNGLLATKAPDGMYELKADSVPPGAGAIVSLGGLPVTLVHGSVGFRVFNATCTHLGCLVKWNPSSNMFICPCHGGKYNANGQVIAGPPPNALAEHKVIEKDDMIRIAIT